MVHIMCQVLYIMLISLEKVCPELIVSVFGTRENKQPTVESVLGKSPWVTWSIHGLPFFTCIAENESKEMPNTGSKADTTPSSSVSFPQDVSHFSQHPGLIPVLTKYKAYLQSCYNARALAAADKYLPTLNAPYINLAMVSREYCDPSQRDEFTRQTLHGGVDEILKSKKPISIEDLLTPEGRRGPVRFILVEGPPGIGKSTFAWEVCRRWDDIESLRDYHTVVLLKLREKWVLNATSLSDLLRYPSHPNFSNSIAEELVHSQGQSLLLVLDGFDEVSHSFHENSVIKSILCRQLLPDCTIILTTRPVAKHTFKSICQPQVDKHVEIIGFTEEERVKYIREVFSTKPELQKNFLKYMFFVPHIKSMMYIPLNCAIIAQVYHESQTSHHLAIPKTRTQLYEALTHSILVRHKKMKDSNFECTSMFPEGLHTADMEIFKVLARFAFHSYHKGRSRKVTFFKEDIPEGLVHFGFMNESTEMYAGKGVERTFSFLHLSLQEYLAAWHLANSYSVDFQVAYHKLATDSHPPHSEIFINLMYKGYDKEEQALISSLVPLGESLMEPAIFLAGITGWRCQSEDVQNPWEMYLSHDTAHVSNVSYLRVLIRSLYEAQNPKIISHYFAAEKNNVFRSKVGINSTFNNCSSVETPYDCYAVSYCIAHYSDEISLFYECGPRNCLHDISLLETFVKGVDDHCQFTTPRVKHLGLWLFHMSAKDLDIVIHWFMKARFFTEIQEMYLQFLNTSSGLVEKFLKSFIRLQSLVIHVESLEWLAALRYLRQLKVLRVFTSSEECSLPPTGIYCGSEGHGLIGGDKLTEVVLDIKIPSNSMNILYTDVLVGSVLKSVLRSNQITEVEMSNTSRETMAGVRSILLHCPSLTTLKLTRTRLGYDGILYICSALRKNKNLNFLLIHDDLQFPLKRGQYDCTSFLRKRTISMPFKTTCTEFLLELNHILKDNTTLKEIKIQSGLFLPLSTCEYGKCCQWTGLGPLQQFNVGAVASGMSPNLRRSFSSSDLTQPQTQLFWDKGFKGYLREKQVSSFDFKKLLSLRKEQGHKPFSLPSFTAPDMAVLQSFSGLDPRLKECLEIQHPYVNIERIKKTYWGVLGKLLK